MDKKVLREERLAYVQYIVGSLKKSWSTLIPTPPEERSFEEALRHVIRVVSSNGLNPTDQDRSGHFGCSSLYYSLHSAEEILELDRQLEELSEPLLGKDIDDDFTLAPLMCMKESNEMMSVLSGSNERSMFYCHKFLLASIDLKNSEFSCCPPFEDEKRSYVHVLNNVAAPLIKAQDHSNVYSEELYQLYLERIYHEMVDTERHLANIRGWILKKLSLTDWWELMTELIQTIEYDEDGKYMDHFVELAKELTEKCEVSNEDLPNYISKIDRCLTIVLLVVVFILERTGDSNNLRNLKTVRTLKQSGWEIVHALSLLKHGPFAGSTFQEQHILQMPQTHVPVEDHQVERKHKHILEGEGQDENVVILEDY